MGSFGFLFQIDTNALPLPYQRRVVEVALKQGRD